MVYSRDTMTKREKYFSLEFFPPRDVEALSKLEATTKELLQIDPAYISVTFGAGGSTQTGTLETVRMIKQFGVDGVPHLSCISNTKAEILAILAEIKAKNEQLSAENLALHIHCATLQAELQAQKEGNLKLKLDLDEQGRKLELKLNAIMEQHLEKKLQKLCSRVTLV